MKTGDILSLKSHLEDVQPTELVTRDNLVILPDSLRARQRDRAELHGDAVQADQGAVVGCAGEGPIAVIHLYWLGQILRDER